MTVFTVASFLCGLATSLPMLLALRVIQGAGGGAFQPIAQSILLESFPKEKHGVAMGVYGIGVVTAPILGPVLGRLDHGQLQLALDLLHQTAGRTFGACG